MFSIFKVVPLHVKSCLVLRRTFCVRLWQLCCLSVIINPSAPQSSHAQTKDLKFEHLTVDDGLPQNTVTSILQDRQGFIWFGTLDGLCKYDGYGFTVYQHDPFDENSLADSEVFSLYEDHSVTLWIGTGKSFCSFDPSDKANRKFANYNLFPVIGVFEDPGGSIWGWPWAGQGITKFNKERREFEHFVDYLDNFEDILVNRVYLDRSGTLWLGTGEGLFRLTGFDGEKWEITNFRHDPNDQHSLPHNGVSVIYEDKSGTIWFGTAGGISRLDHDENGMEKFINYRSHLNISSLLGDSDGSLWIGTMGNGLGKLLLEQDEKLNNEEGEFVYYKNDPSDPNSISSNNVSSILRDDSGIMWVGTRGGGVCKFDTESIRFRHYKHDLTNPNRPSSNRVWSFYEDRSGSLWVGTSNGLSLFDRKVNETTKFTKYTLNTANSNSAANHRIRAIYEDSLGTFWIGTLDSGLGNLNRETGHVTYYAHDPSNPNSISVYTIWEDRSGRLWAGTNGAGLSKFDVSTHQFTHYNHLLHRKVGENLGWVITIHEDRSGLLWLGTWKEGLIRFDPKSEEHTHYMDEPADPKSLGSQTVFSIHEDKAGVLWIGTYGGGLCRAERREGDEVTFQCFTVKDGLPNNVIYGILEDDFGNLWLSTNQGISMLNPETQEFRNYDLSDGLQSNEFNLGAYYKSKSGEMFFGGPNGFNSFYPDDIVNSHPPKIALTAFKKFGKEVGLDKSLSDIKAIELSYQEDFFSFEFVVLHYKNSKKNRYAYMMEGFDKDWIDIGTKREASYTNLDPGEYTFRVKAANSDGIWNEEGIAVRVNITPPFWRTWWFFSLSCSLFALACLGVYKYRIGHALRLEHMRVTERERIRSKMTADFHDELGHRATKIALTSKLLLREQPNAASRVKKDLSIIVNHADSLFKEMKDFIWQLDPQKDSVYDLAVQLKNFSDDLFERTEIAFQLSPLSEELERITLLMDWRQQLLRIFKEALHNVLKHAQGCKNVTLESSVWAMDLQITLRDDGDGFDPMDFRPGNGLKNMQERAKKIGGKVEIKSEIHKGTTIQFSGKLP